MGIYAESLFTRQKAFDWVRTSHIGETEPIQRE